jgi:hypothetical protein
MARWTRGLLVCVLVVGGASVLLAFPADVHAQQTAYTVRECLSGCSGWDLLRYDVASGSRLGDVRLSDHPLLGAATLSGSG